MATDNKDKKKVDLGNPTVRTALIKNMEHFKPAKAFFLKEHKDANERREGWLVWGKFLAELKEKIPANQEYSKELEKLIPGSTDKRLKQTNSNAKLMVTEWDSVSKFLKESKTKISHPTALLNAWRTWKKEKAAEEARESALTEIMDDTGMSRKEAEKELDSVDETEKEKEKQKRKNNRGDSGAEADKTTINGMILEKIDKGARIALLTEVCGLFTQDVNLNKLTSDEITEIERVISTLQNILPNTFKKAINQ